MRRRVVITGIGAITPIGSGRDGLWHGLRRGASAIGPLTRFDARDFPARNAAEINDFDPLDYMDARKARRLDRFSQLALGVAHQALADAGIDPGRQNGKPMGVYIGSALGGIAFGEQQHARFVGSGIRGVEPSVALAVFGGAGASNVAIEFGLRGPAMGNANSCASGAIAIGEALRVIQAGAADVMLAGGVEAPLAPLTFGSFALIKAMSRRSASPETASRPFDRDRDGFVMAEGAALFVLETLEHAEARGAAPLAELRGYGASNDAYHMVTPLPSGAEAARAMALALADAQLSAADIGYLNAHATSTPLGDVAEARAIRSAFGPDADRLPVSATKGLYGHALGASGAIEAAITALVVGRSWLPPTTNLTNPDPECRLNHVTGEGVERVVEHAMSNAFGFGGANASLVLSRWRG